MGADQLCLLRKILTRLRVTNFCTSLTRFRLSVVTQPNGPKWTQIAWNAQKQEFRVQWGRIGCVCCEKFWRDFVARTFAPVLFVLHRVRQPNSPKCAQVEQNAWKQEFRVQLVGLGAFIAKIPTRLGSMNFCTCRPVLHRVFASQPNSPKCSKISMKCTRTWV